jgi:hypothetical protein
MLLPQLKAVDNMAILPGTEAAASFHLLGC